MFCVIQEIERKKANRNGYYKELKSEWLNYSFNGEDRGYYYHNYGGDQFERPVRKAYRISIHENYREAGQMKKRQFPICTAGYDELAEDFISLYDWGGSRIEAAADALQVDMDVIYDLIGKKIAPLQAKIQAEFMQTEEYKVHAEHERITTIYAARKAEFNEKYDLESGSNDYDRCYDVFGNLGHPENLEKVKAQYKARQEYERQSRKNSRSYYDNFWNNYKNGSYDSSIGGNHSEKDKDILKQFYRELSKKFHPDSNPDKDTAEEMKVLNQLKQEWGI